MKILLLSEGRTGSYSVMEWIQVDLKLQIIGETTPYDYINNDNIIVKRTLSNKDFDLDDVKYFDKVIVLYREDTLSQAESSLWAVEKKSWHHSPGESDGFYETDDNFLIKNHRKIWDIKYGFDILLEKYKSLDFGLHISYEDIFERKISTKIIEDYIGFVASTSLTPSVNKLRIFNPRQRLESIIREMSSTGQRLYEWESEMSRLKKEIELLKHNKLI